MESLNLRAVAAIVGSMLAIIAIAVVVVRIVRARPRPQPPADLPVFGTDPAFLDSSHIIGGPTTVSPQPAVPGADANAERDGESASRRGGGTAP